MQGHPAQLLKPRKKPNQQRSETTVRAIVEAAAQVLAVNRYEKTTTNHIADRAGVSVGTIYEYFPNKDVLLSEVQSYWNDVCWEHAQSFEAAPPRLSLEALIELLVERWLSIFRLNPDLYSALVHDLPTRGNKWKADARLQQSVETVASLLSSHVDRLRVDNIDLAAEILVRGIQSYLDSLVAKQPSLVNEIGLSKRIAILVAQLVIK